MPEIPNNQTNDNGAIKQTVLQWHFWFLVAFSLFLIVTFVYYLPLRFLHKSGSGAHTMAEDASIPMATQDGAHAHGASMIHEEKDIHEGLTINMNASPVPFMAGVPTRLNFFVNIKPGNTPVPLSELEVEHEKLMHVIGVRSDMNEFFHAHPQLPQQPLQLVPETEDMIPQPPTPDAPAALETDHVFNQPGLYKIWSEIKKSGVIHYVGHEPLSVNGEGPREDKKVSYGRSMIVGGYQVALTINDVIGKGIANDMAFEIHDSNGNEVQVEPYLGAEMHLVIIKDDWTEFMHVHPEPESHGHAARFRVAPHRALLWCGAPNCSFSLVHEVLADEGHAHTTTGTMGAGAMHGINFHATFPTAGLYRAFAQFRPAGIQLQPDEALTAAFWIKVDEKAPQSVSVNSQWWGLLLVSILAIGALSYGVNRYLKGGQA